MYKPQCLSGSRSSGPSFWSDFGPTPVDLLMLAHTPYSVTNVGAGVARTSSARQPEAQISFESFSCLRLLSSTQMCIRDSSETNGPGATTHFRRRGNIGGLSAGVRVEQDTLYYQALALQKLGQPDDAAAIYTQLLDIGSKMLAAAPEMPIQSAASQTQRCLLYTSRCV